MWARTRVVAVLVRVASGPGCLVAPRSREATRTATGYESSDPHTAGTRPGSGRTANTVALPSPKAALPVPHEYLAGRASHLELEEAGPSIGSVGDAYESALMEPVIRLFQPECIRTRVFNPGPSRTHPDVEYTTAGSPRHGTIRCTLRRRL